MIENGSNVQIVTMEEIQAAIPHRLPGYYEECLRRGQLDATGKIFTFTKQDFREIRESFNPKTGGNFIRFGCCG